MSVPVLDFWWLPGAIFVYLAIGAIIAGYFDRSRSAYDYSEWWGLIALLWPVALGWMLGEVMFAVGNFLGAPLRWIYHWVRLRGRDKEL